jgi:hypothetical protein
MISERPRLPTLARGATDAASEASKHSGVTRVSVGCTALLGIVFLIL